MKIVAGGALVCTALAVVMLWMKLRRRRRLQAGLEALRGKVVLITGASSGLGEACAHAFYRAGCRVIICARTEEELTHVIKDLENVQRKWPSEEVKFVTFDLADIPGISAAMKQANSFYGHVDILINNGGISYRGSIIDTKIEVDVSVMNINYFGAVAVTKGLLPKMVERNSGHVVAISSIQGKVAIPFRSAYSSSKHAVQSFFDTLRAEVAQHGIHVSVISPAYIQTNLSLFAVTSSGKTYGKMDETTKSGMTAEAVAREVVHSVAARRNELLLGPFHYRLATYLRNILPDAFAKVMAKRAQKQIGAEKKTT